MRLNIGCGKQTWDGFFCVDAVRHPKASRPPDLLHAFEFEVDRLLNPLPLPDGCATEVHSYHFIEHFRAYEAPALVRDWRRLLRDGGLLVLELPNIEAACRNLLAGMPPQMCWWPLYGDDSHRDPYMLHKFGYTPKTLRQLLESNGFRDVRFEPPQTHGKRANRDMRAVARKA